MPPVTKLLRSGTFQSVLAMYGVQMARKVIPIVTIPILARALGASGWGTVAFVLSFATFLVLLVEFGFDLSATREIARHRDSKERCAEIVAGVIGAQLLLFVTALVGGTIVALCVPQLREHPLLLIAGFCFVLAQGMSPLWFFQGMERLRLAASLDILGKLLSLAGMLLFIRTPQDDWKVMLLYAVPPAFFTIAGLWMVFRLVPYRSPNLAAIREALASGWRLFLFRSAKNLYGSANVFILGLFAGPVTVGYFAAAEKINTSVYGLLNPIEQVLYPRLSHLVHEAPEQAVRLLRVGVALMVAGGLILMAALLLGAPLLVRTLLGPGFTEAVSILRTLSLLLPFAAITISVGFQWLLPLGLDHVVNRIILAGGLLNVLLGVAWASRFGHHGMAWAVVCTEVFVCLATVASVAMFAPFWKTPARRDVAFTGVGLERSASPVSE